MKTILIFTFTLLISAPSFSLNTGAANEQHEFNSGDGIVTTMVDDAAETLTVRLVVRSGMERARVILVSREGNEIHNEVTFVGSEGVQIEISTAGLPGGDYYLRVKGDSFNHSQRIPLR